VQSLTAVARLATLAAMSEGTKALRAVKLWDAWGGALARSDGDLAALLAAATPRISAKKPATRLRLGLRHRPEHGQLTLDLRVDFGGAPRAELELDGSIHRQNAVIGDASTSEWSAVGFGGKYVELRMIHEGVPKLMDAVYARSTFLPRLPALGEVARIVGLESAIDVALGSAQRIHFEVRQGKDERPAFESMGFALTDDRGAPFTADDEGLWQETHGPNAGWPCGVAWRRDDDIIHNNGTASFGAGARRIFHR